MTSRASRFLVSAIFLVLAFGVLALGAIGIGPQTNLVGNTSANQATEAAATAEDPANASPLPSAPSANGNTAAGTGTPTSSPANGVPNETSQTADLTRHLAVTLPRPADPDELTGYQWPLIHGRLTLPYGARGLPDRGQRAFPRRHRPRHVLRRSDRGGPRGRRRRGEPPFRSRDRLDRRSRSVLPPARCQEALGHASDRDHHR